MEDIVVGDTTLARIATDVQLMVGHGRHGQLRRRVELNVTMLRTVASRVMRKRRVAWPEYADFMRRCGFEASREDKHEAPRVCVAPFDAPLITDCLGMTERGNKDDVDGLGIAHIYRVVHWMRGSTQSRRNLTVSSRRCTRTRSGSTGSVRDCTGSG